LPDREQDGGLEVLRAGDRALLEPRLGVLPERRAHHQLAMVDRVAGRPLGLQAREAGVADEAAVAVAGGLQPVDEVPAVARARRRLAGSVDERVAPDRLVGGLVDVVGGAAALSTLESWSLVCFLATGSMRTTSGGFTALPQVPTMTVPGARSGISIEARAPRESSTGEGVPPFALTE